jgi:hypothetical protein
MPNVPSDSEGKWQSTLTNREKLIVILNLLTSMFQDLCLQRCRTEFGMTL